MESTRCIAAAHSRCRPDTKTKKKKKRKTQTRTTWGMKEWWCATRPLVFLFDYQGGLLFSSCVPLYRRAQLSRTRTHKTYIIPALPAFLIISFHLIHDRIKRATSVKKNDSRIYIFIIGSFSLYISLVVYFHPKGFDRGKENANSLQRPLNKKETQVILFRPFFFFFLLYTELLVVCA